MTERSHRPARGRRTIRLVVVAAIALASLMAAPAASQAGTTGKGHGDAWLDWICAHRTNNTYAKALQCVSSDGVLDHLEELQSIASANGDSRASSTPGYDGSVDYVAGKLEQAGYEVTRQPFDFYYFEELASSLTIDGQEVETGAYEYSGSGDITGTVVPVDLNLDGDRASDSGCEPEDFDSVDLSGENDVALIQRGACAFGLKAINAQNAGAEAVIIFNQGNGEGRTDLIVGTLGDDAAGVVTIPVVGASFDQGQAMADDLSTVTVVTDVFLELRTTENIIADSTKGDPDNVVMAGAHLDSVPEGPGINDNGSGSAALLETALTLAKIRPENQMRFAWWGAEESGLIGSTYYVGTLPEEELAKLALYLNFDMVGSPNYVHTVYDADESTFAAADFGVVVPEGSVAIEDLFEQFYTWKDVPYDDAAFSGRSDYQAFIFSDIPASGLFTGAEVVKTPEQEAIWGGTAGEQFDPCYHEACDTIDNVSAEALDINADAVTFAMLTLAYSTEDVNGVPGRRVPGWPIDLPEPAGPQGTFVGSSGASPGADAE